MTRSDIQASLPIVYNGKSVEDWYKLYCKTVLELELTRALLRQVAIGTVDLQQEGICCMRIPTETLEGIKRLLK